MRKPLIRKAWVGLASVLPALLALQLALNAAIDSRWPHVRDPQWEARATRLRRLKAENPDARLVLMLGSSRTQLALCGGLLADDSGDAPTLVFNVGIPASGPMMELVGLRRLLKAGIRPELLFIEIMPALLSANSDRLAEESKLAYDSLSWPEVHEVAPYCLSKRMLLSRACLTRLLVATRRGPELRRALKIDAGPSAEQGIEDGLTMREFGWCPPTKELSSVKRAELTRTTCRIYARRFDRFEITARSTRALRDLLDLCQNERLPTVLVWMPEGSSFRALYSSDIARRVCESLSEITGNRNVPLVDARFWVPDDDFFDGHHMLPEGAAIFSERFSRECVRPLLKALPGRAEWQ